MRLESPKTVVAKSSGDVFTLLTDVKNFEKLMPDTVVKFEITGRDEFLFALKGMPEISLRLREQHSPEKIIYEAAGGKIPFALTIHINATAPAKSEVQFLFNGEFNAMMAMMVKKPISNFIGVLSKNTSKL